jgi:hypothetical protein
MSFSRALRDNKGWLIFMFAYNLKMLKPGSNQIAGIGRPGMRQAAKNACQRADHH